MFKGKKVLITGGTGSLGQALTKRLLDLKVDTIRIFSRNENKQVTMESKFNDERLRFLIGDVRDLPRLEKAIEDIDIVFHAAALKHVPVIEYNPFEAIKTNVIGSQNVIDASINENVDIAVCIGTDKAVSPLNAYGATKLLMEKLFISTSNYISKKRSKFIAVRYGNVLGSSGSVVPKFIEQVKNGKPTTITNPKMTRFSITMNEALDFILESTKLAKGSEIFIPKLRAYQIQDLRNAILEMFHKTDEKTIPIRPGEKMHEILINRQEIQYTWELDNKFLLFNPLLSEKEIKKMHPSIKKLKNLEEYSSNSVAKIPKNEIIKLIKKNGIVDHEF